MKKRRKIVILTGAGVSKESGINTFRDNGGTWDKYNIEDVATTNALKNNTKIFCEFYNKRKNELKEVEPNKAHIIIKDMEKDFDVTIITQNVDNLHERAGSSKIYHLHGTLTKLRSSFNPGYTIDYNEDLKEGDLCPEGAQMRPDIVLFGEDLPLSELDNSFSAITEADTLIIIGTSLRVYPAAQLPWDTPDNCLIYYIDPADLEVNVPKPKRSFFYHIQEVASTGIKKVYEELREIYL